MSFCIVPSLWESYWSQSKTCLKENVCKLPKRHKFCYFLESSSMLAYFSKSTFQFTKLCYIANPHLACPFGFIDVWYLGRFWVDLSRQTSMPMIYSPIQWQNFLSIADCQGKSNVLMTRSIFLLHLIKNKKTAAMQLKKKRGKIVVERSHQQTKKQKIANAP